MDKRADGAVMPHDAKTHDAPQASFDVEAFSMNLARFVEESGKAAAAYMKPRESGEISTKGGAETTDLFKTLGHVAEYWLSDPARTLSAQTAFASRFIDLWGNTLRRFSGETTEPIVPPEPSDRRFAAPEWQESPFFDFLRQAYTLSTHWADDLVMKAEALDPQTRAKAKFYIKQISSALAPSNFLATNPELLRETFEQNGENLVSGMKMLTQDIAAGKGNLRIRQTDEAKFELGVNTAVSPGKVIFRNDLIELIQYAPTTGEVFRRPLLLVPPWINKFYVLDLNPDKSFIAWMVAQGLTVFVISWVNPDARHAAKGFEHYMREGIFEALNAIEAATGETQVTALGYCVGGTLLTVSLAYMAAVGDQRIASATFLATQIDFSEAGDLKIFVDEEQLRSIEATMATQGFLDGADMANAFNMLRPNDLIWPYVVNTYMRGISPKAFDLLAWNADATRMTAANHSFYLRHCYLNNSLSRGDMAIAGEKLDVGRVTIPIYDLATREDHIAPGSSCFTGAKLFGGDVRFVLSGSGHIAGVINPPAKQKYQFWSGPKTKGAFTDWLEKAEERKGSWWPDWMAWIAAQAQDKVNARQPGTGKLAALGDAPGTYVRVRS